MTNKLNAVITMIENGDFEQVYQKLLNDVSKKTGGCAVNGSPDKNDLIETCEAQAAVYPLIMEIAQVLEELING